jgi:hypothetical protein
MEWDFAAGFGRRDSPHRSREIGRILGRREEIDIRFGADSSELFIM